MKMLSSLRQAGIAAGIACGALAGCATVGPDEPGWGRDARAAPGWARVRDAAVNAARSPFTWAPVIGAIALQFGDLDDDIAEEAMDNTPIFGSTSGADDASDVLRGASWVFYATTGLLAPRVDDAPARQAKLKGFGVGAAAIGVTQVLTAGLKSGTDRERPNDRDDNSFPSGHASAAAVALRLTQRNLEYFDLAPNARRTLNAGFGAIGAMTGWARVEAGEHHLSDVLVGGALGNFLGMFVSDAFLGRGRNQGLTARFELSRSSAVTQLHWDL